MPVIKFIIKLLSGVLLIVAGFYIFIEVMNADLYGRLTEVKTVKHAEGPNTPTVDFPTVRLVLHKVLADENSVEASIIIYHNGLINSDHIRKGKITYSATIGDGVSFQPHGIRHLVTLDSTAIQKYEDSYPAIESERFLLPVVPSLNGFPLDNLEIYPSIYFYRNDQNTTEYNLEVQKAIPGRLINLKNQDEFVIELTRSNSEIAFIFVGSLAFLIISGVIIYSLYAPSEGVNTFEELIGVAGFFIATVGYRDILGLSRNAGISALEIAVIGIPMILLTYSLVVSYVRYHKQKSPSNKKTVI